MTSQGEFWDRHVFSVGGEDFTWFDVAMSAMVRGQWSAFERRLAEGLACAARAACDCAEPAADAIDEAATAFRYERDLISAADVTQWLDRAALTAEEWTDYIRRDLLRRTWEGDLDDILDRFAPSARELTEAADVEAICSGTFDAFEQGFAGRAAFVFEADAAAFGDACKHDEAPLADPSVARLALTHAHWLSIPATGAAARLSMIARLEAAFTALSTRVASNGRLSQIVEAKRLDWMQVEFETVSFATEQAAREAVLCMREDGLSMYDVASLARRTVTRQKIALEDVEADQRDQLLAADPGRVLGPIPVDGRFDVAHLVSRTPPSLSDPDITERATAAALEIAQQTAARDHVTRPGP